MAETGSTSVDRYIAAQPEGVRSTLDRVRRAILRAVPDADERMAYDMPSYELHGKPILQFAVWKRHYALYLATDSLLAAFPGELDAYDIKKGTLGIAFSQPVPEALIERIARFRAEHAAATGAVVSEHRTRSRSDSNPPS